MNPFFAGVCGFCTCLVFCIIGINIGYVLGSYEVVYRWRQFERQDVIKEHCQNFALETPTMRSIVERDEVLETKEGKHE